MLTNLLYVLIAIVLLGVIIIVHELGHFAVGRLCGIGVVEFSVGFGPKLFGWKRKGIDYSVRVLPFGGYCKFVGEDDDNPSPNAMNQMPVWKRFLTVFAGPAMNFVLAYLAAVAMLCMFYGTVEPRIETVVADMPAAEAQLQPGEVSKAFIMKDPKRDRDIVALVKLTYRTEAHQANLSDDYQLIKDMYEESQKEKILQDWLEKKIADTYVRIEDGWRGCDFQHKGWVKTR